VRERLAFAREAGTQPSPNTALFAFGAEFSRWGKAKKKKEK